MSIQRKKLLQEMSKVLFYPEPSISETLNEISGLLSSYDSFCSARFESFRHQFEQWNETEREEIFTRTFDLSPVCTPYVGIHLFGEENYKRGELMSHLNESYHKVQYSSTGELPDHLGVLLPYAAQTSEEEFRSLVEFCLLGPIARMIQKLGDKNAYEVFLETIQAVLKKEAPGVSAAPLPVAQIPLSCASQSGGGCGSGSKQETRTKTVSQCQEVRV